MIARTLLGIVVFASLLAGGSVYAGSPVGVRSVDKASACARRQRPACTLKYAERALARLPKPAHRLRHEARVLRAAALATLGRDGDARQAYALILKRRPAWRPSSDAPAAITRAFSAALTARIRGALPKRITPGRPPLPPQPKVSVRPAKPLMYRLPAASVRALSRRPTGRWRLAIGGGIAQVVGEGHDRYAIGIQAALEVSLRVAKIWSVFVTASLTLHDFDETLAVEPGYSRGLTTAAIGFGVMASFRVAPKFDLLAAVSAGGGFFGLRGLSEAAGFAFQVSGGLRYAIGDGLAVRLDAGPTFMLPITGPAGSATHINALLRVEALF